VALIFLNRYFYPDHSATSQLLSDLAFALASDSEPEGHTVTIITSRLSYDDPSLALPPQETIRGVDVKRIWTTRFGRTNLVGRAIDYLTFYVSAAWALGRLARSGDVIIAKTDPPMLSVIAAPIARWRGAKLINWLQDLFPEVAQAVGPGGGGIMSPLYRAMAYLRDRSLRSAKMNVVLGERMAARVEAMNVPRERIRIISNWADGDLLRPLPPAENPLRREWGLADAIVVGYSGNLGRAHDYATLLEAIALLDQRTPSDPDAGGTAKSSVRRDAIGRDANERASLKTESSLPTIVWLFIGGGALYSAFQHEVATRGLSSVVFKPYQPRERLSESLSAADIHLVSLRPDLEGLIVPSKFHGVTAVGRPTLFIGDQDGEIAALVARHDCGMTVPQGDSAALALAVLALVDDPEGRARMGANARRAFETDFAKSIAVRRWRDLLTEIKLKP